MASLITDNGRQFTDPRANKKKSLHVFDKLCQKEGIRHRLTKPYHPWTNGQVEKVNRTIKEAAVYRYYTDFGLKIQVLIEGKKTQNSNTISILCFL